MKKKVFSSHQCSPESSAGCQAAAGVPANGDSQPPKNSTAVSAAIRVMAAYSARKNSAKAAPEYSTWKPATSSDSPSTTSNGARLVSATPDTRYTSSSGSSGQANQAPTPPACAATMAARLRLPASISTPTSAKPMAIS